jgi:hypothetical protein
MNIRSLGLASWLLVASLSVQNLACGSGDGDGGSAADAGRTGGGGAGNGGGAGGGAAGGAAGAAGGSAGGAGGDAAGGTGGGASGGAGGGSDTPDYEDTSTAALEGGRKVVTVNGNASLTSALANAACKTTIELQTATYSSNQTLDENGCSQAEAIIVREAPGHTATFTGTFTLGGSFNILGPSIGFSGPNGRVRQQGFSTKVIGNTFSGFKGVAIVTNAETTPGERAEVAYNDIGNPAGWDADPGCPAPPSTTQTGDGCQTQIRRGLFLSSSPQASSVMLGGWIHHNYLHDFPNKPNPGIYASGDSDALELCESSYGWAQELQIGWYVEWNLIERHLQGGQTAMDIKCGGTVFRYNTNANSSNTKFDFRVGSYNILESNWNESGGTTIHGGHNKVVCNHLSSELRVRSGNYPWDVDVFYSGHTQAYDTLVESNEASLLWVGFQTNPAEQLYPADLTVIRNHTGPIQLDSQTNTTNTPRAAATYHCLPPVRLTPSQVGPSAAGSAPSAWKAARGIP